MALCYGHCWFRGSRITSEKNPVSSTWTQVLLFNKNVQSMWTGRKFFIQVFHPSIRCLCRRVNACQAGAYCLESLFERRASSLTGCCSIMGQHRDTKPGTHTNIPKIHYLERTHTCLGRRCICHEYRPKAWSQTQDLPYTFWLIWSVYQSLIGELQWFPFYTKTKFRKYTQNIVSSCKSNMLWPAGSDIIVLAGRLHDCNHPALSEFFPLEPVFHRLYTLPPILI